MKAIILFIVFIVIAFLVLSLSSGNTAINSIVNPIKKVTGQTSHKRRVLFNDYADTIKYNIETGQRVSFMTQKLVDAIDIPGKLKDSLTVPVMSSSEEIIGSSEAAIGIEEIAAMSVIV